MKRNVPPSTYRLQLHAGFTFADATAIVPYLAELGVGAVYVSPILRAQRGSTHGYDVVDHGTINPELGGAEGFAALASALRARGVGLVVDFVPNHMGIAGGDNGWWNDVLENGPSSLYADSFDIEWSPPKASLKNKVLYPILGAQYGEVLENGELAIVREGGAFFLRYYEHRLPVAPRSLIPLLQRASERVTLPPDHPCALELRSIATALEHLPLREDTAPEKRQERAREKEIVKRRIQDLAAGCPEAAQAIDAAIEEANGKKGDPRSFDRLDRILLEQSFRLAYWRVAGEEINYRRFFDVNTLVAVRMEAPQVFDAAHAVIFARIADGTISGLRLDHTDGLYDPADYFERLRARGAGDVYLLAEKILEPGEKLPRSWKIEGTTGYDALCSTLGLWVDPAAEAAMTALYKRVTGDDLGFAEHVHRGKRAVLRGSFAAEINMLAQSLERIAEASRLSRDFTLRNLTFAILETIAAFPVYRTYIRADGTREPNDEQHVQRAIRLAKRRNPEVDPSVFDFLNDVLLLRDLRGADASTREAQVRFAMRFQQITGPIMAKGVEDTAFYRYYRLIALNEVGGQPSRFGTSVERWHADNAERAASWPYTMTTSSTHDTKRGEDVRARICVLSEIPDEWARYVDQWRAIAARHRSTVDEEPAPSAGDEYLFFQTVLGATPFARVDDEALRAMTDRLVAYMAKATKEAKLRTSWTNPNAEYDAAVERFTRAMMADAELIASVRALADATATYAATNALAQTALKLTMPGVPDTYQGCEGWSFCLVDPDNRCAVDYEWRRAALAEIQRREGDRAALARDLLDRFRDGAVKLWLTRALLRVRRNRADLFAHGAYRAIDGGEHVIAFAREHEGQRAITVVPRFARKLTQGRWPWPTGEAWGPREIEVPAGRWENVLTGEALDAAAGRLAMRDVLRGFPVAVLVAG